MNINIKLFTRGATPRTLVAEASTLGGWPNPLTIVADSGRRSSFFQTHIERDEEMEVVAIHYKPYLKTNPIHSVTIFND